MKTKMCPTCIGEGKIRDSIEVKAPKKPLLERLWTPKVQALASPVTKIFITAAMLPIFITACSLLMRFTMWMAELPPDPGFKAGAAIVGGIIGIIASIVCASIYFDP